VKPVKIALSVAGSDPSGGAGIQSDLKTFSRLHVYGMAVIAALTAQNTLGVSGLAEIEPDFLEKQLDAVLTDITPDAAKTGMLLTASAVEIVAQKIYQYRIRNVVVDPVMVSTSGAALLAPDAVNTVRRALLPLAFLVTPNLDEARTLTGKPIDNIEDMEEAALQIHGMGASNVLIKGGHAQSHEITDLFFDGNDFAHLRSTRIEARNTHGTGCVLSAAIAAHLALGRPTLEAVRLGKEFVTEAIQNGLAIGSGTGPCDPLALNG
jgi:hydroxymethylpyrimidine/phosphomethylpyrimidine kinase